MEQLWIDKYRPKQLDDFTYNLEAIEIFKKLSKNSTDLPHLIVEGVTGIGKKSIVMAFIKECIDQFGLNGDEIYRTQNIDISLKYPNKKIDLNIQKSLFHYNLNPSDYGIYDRHIVQDFLKSQFRYKTLTGFPYKNVIIRNAENLSLDAQQSLRRTLENCIKNCRFIFIVNTEKQGNLIMALNSRCIRIRMSVPTRDEAFNVISRILDTENVKVESRLIHNVYKKCHGNLSHAVNLLQLMQTTTPAHQLSKQLVVNVPEICPITKCCNNIVMKMFTSENLGLVTEIRSNLYTLLTHGVDAEDIVKRIFKIVIHNLIGWELRVIRITDEVELKLKKSSREFYHLENYVVKLLVIIKQYQIENKNESKKKTTIKKTPRKTLNLIKKDTNPPNR